MELIYMFVGLFVVVFVGYSIMLAMMSPSQRKDHLEGKVNPVMECPHCHHTNCVRTKIVNDKRGISGGKVTGALLTGGASILATGLSQKKRVTKATCDKCKNIWLF